jgi:hypothetical protein
VGDLLVQGAEDPHRPLARCAAAAPARRAARSGGLPHQQDAHAALPRPRGRRTERGGVLRRPVVTYYLPFELRAECKAPARLCVASKVPAAAPEFATAAEHWAGADVKFFQGDEDWPGSAFKVGQTYLVRPDQNELCLVRQIKSLGEMIVKAIESPDSVTWIKY